MAYIFLCYRREDTSTWALLLHKALTQDFGQTVFMDIDSLQPGVNWVQTIDDTLNRCDAVLVLIGPRWSDIKNDSGRRRLVDQKDPVRLEIKTALERGIPVVPVFLDGASMPEARKLPKALSSLSAQNGVTISTARWMDDVSRLVQGLAPALGRQAVPAGDTDVMRGQEVAEEEAPGAEEEAGGAEEARRQEAAEEAAEEEARRQEAAKEEARRAEEARRQEAAEEARRQEAAKEEARRAEEEARRRRSAQLQREIRAAADKRDWQIVAFLTEVLATVDPGAATAHGIAGLKATAQREMSRQAEREQRRQQETQEEVHRDQEARARQEAQEEARRRRSAQLREEIRAAADKGDWRIVVILADVLATVDPGAASTYEVVWQKAAAQREINRPAPAAPDQPPRQQEAAEQARRNQAALRQQEATEQARRAQAARQQKEAEDQSRRHRSAQLREEIRAAADKRDWQIVVILTDVLATVDPGAASSRDLVRLKTAAQREMSRRTPGVER
jgi:hypothetical protein